MELGRSGEDDSFYFTEYAAPADCDTDDEEAWAVVNPALDDFPHRLYEAIMNGTVSHSGDPRLERHITNAVVKVDARRARILKEHKSSTRQIDLAVAAVMTFNRAAQAESELVPSIWFA